MAALILKIGISRNPICDNLVGFPKSGHNFALCGVKIGVFMILNSMEAFILHQNHSLVTKAMPTSNPPLIGITLWHKILTNQD